MTTLQKPRQNGDRHARKSWHRFGHGDQGFATPRHGNTKPLPKSKRDGNEAILTTPGSAKRSDKQVTGVGKLHGALEAKRRRGDEETQAAIEHDNGGQFPPNRACGRRPPRHQTGTQPTGGALQC